MKYKDSNKIISEDDLSEYIKYHSQEPWHPPQITETWEYGNCNGVEKYILVAVSCEEGIPPSIEELTEWNKSIKCFDVENYFKVDIITCDDCGTKCRDGDKFCFNCGFCLRCD